jgi:hypothetical protein
MVTKLKAFVGLLRAVFDRLMHFGAQGASSTWLVGVYLITFLAFVIATALLFGPTDAIEMLQGIPPFET